MPIRAALVAFVLSLAVTAAAAQQPAPASQFRASAQVQLRLAYQGTGEGMISRGFRLFGASGRCEAWYTITEVIATPGSLLIHAGDRLRLRYSCGRDREYDPGDHKDQANWARPGRQSYAARVWLRSRDIKADGRGVWSVANPRDRYAPVANSNKP